MYPHTFCQKSGSWYMNNKQTIVISGIGTYQNMKMAGGSNLRIQQLAPDQRNSLLQCKIGVPQSPSKLRHEMGLQNIQIFRMSHGMVDPRVVCLRLHIPWSQAKEHKIPPDRDLQHETILADTCHCLIDWSLLSFFHDISAAADSVRNHVNQILLSYLV